MSHLTYFGKIIPERAALNIDGPTKTFFKYEPYGKCEATIHLYVSQLVVDFKTEIDIDDFISAKNFISEFSQQYVDLAGFLLGVGYEMEITSSINHLNEQVLVYGANVSVFDEDIEVRKKRFGKAKKHIGISKYLGIALVDLRLAIRIPHDTGMYCYRVFETILHDFCNPEESKSKSLERMANALQIGSGTKFKRFLGRYAGDRRHGKPIEITGEERLAVMHRAWLLVDRYIEYLDRGRSPLPADEFPVPEFNARQ
ncbi:MAG TPA: hypothetical protein VKA94_02965 [Hyphomicrobiales bacterium]|nr:hypothetical protein [Hyphomicrobiales bacterium]